MAEIERPIRVDSIVSTADREQGDITALANSIEQLGLLQPILLRPMPEGKYEVIDGRRRFAAMRQLGWTVVPPYAYAFAPTVGDPAIMAHVANVERKQLKPSEELAQLAGLAETHTMEELADRLGRSPGWIARRLKIRDLSEEWRKVLDDPEIAGFWSLDKLALIARQPPHIQKELEWMLDDGDVPSLDEIQNEIVDLTHALSGAIFDRAACANCVYNSSLQKFLFDDIGEGCCLDPVCYEQKTVEILKAKLAAKPELIPVENGYGLEKFFPNALSHWNTKGIRAPKTGEKPNCLIVSGDHLGEELFAEISKQQASREKKKKSAAQAAAETEATRQEPTLEEREAVLAQKRNRRALELLADYLQKSYKGKEWAAAVPECQKLDHFLNTVRLYGFSGPFTHDSRCQLTRKQVIPATDGLFEAVYDQTRHRLAQNLDSEVRNTLADISREAGDAVAELCCIIPKWIEIKQQAAAEVPEPKALIEARKKATKKGN